MKTLIYITIFLMSGIWLSSCRTQYVPIETVRTEYKTRDSIRHDSIYERDSIYTIVKGDTVYQHRYRYLYKYLSINKTDTVIRVDSIQIPYPVEKQLTKWQSLKMELGGWAFVIVLVAVGWLVFRIRRKLL